MRCSLVSNKIIQARERLGLTQQQLAEKLCVTNKAVSKWECGVTLPDISLLVPLCRVLGLTVQELLDEYDGKFGNTPGCQTMEDPAQDTLFAAQQHSHYLYIDLKTTSTVSPHLFGHNLEHTRASIMDGLSAQMIRNRKFAGAAARNGVALDWEGIGECVYFANEHRLPGSNANEAYVCHYAHNGMWRRNECQSQMIQNPIPNQVSGIRQKELFLQKDRSYPFAVVVKVQQPLDVRVALTNADGTQIYAETVFPVQPVLAKEDAQEEVDEWQRFETILTPGVDDAHAVISITYTEQAQLLIGAVSMMPDNHFHTMRRDTVEKLKEIGVRLLRWPGGNFAGEYRWQDMFLHPDRRAPMEGYMENETQPFTHGYDMHEIDTDDFIALCREIGAEPFLTINAAWDSPEVCAAWVEYCNGPAQAACPARSSGALQCQMVVAGQRNGLWPHGGRKYAGWIRIAGGNACACHAEGHAGSEICFFRPLSESGVGRCFHQEAGSHCAIRFSAYVQFSPLGLHLSGGHGALL